VAALWVTARAGEHLSTTEGGERIGVLRRTASRVVAGYTHFRSSVARNPLIDLVYRVFVGVLGLAVVVIGIIALPAPGPGWAIIFLGLGILATEFEGARRLLHWVRLRYEAWVRWMSRQVKLVKLAISVGILLLVAVCAWFVGVFAVVAGWLGISWPWLHSPVAALLGF
jgi:uncharacterized protein (TIGR02611 family)